jgi:microcystin-dependent protein
MNSKHIIWLPSALLIAFLAIAASRESSTNTKTAAVNQDLYRRLEAIESNQQAPIGSVVAFMGKTLPEGWLPCDGRPVNSKLLPILFEKIGRLHGAGGALTAEGLQGDFNLPDLRGVFLRGVDRGKGLDSEERKPASEESRNYDYIGSFQDFATARPKNAFVTDKPGNHSHAPDGGELVFSDGNETSADEDTTPGQTNVTERKKLVPAGDHSHKVIEGGDKETRPVNISVLYVIRVK